MNFDTFFLLEGKVVSKKVFKEALKTSDKKFRDIQVLLTLRQLFGIAKRVCKMKIADIPVFIRKNIPIEIDGERYDECVKCISYFCSKLRKKKTLTRSPYYNGSPLTKDDFLEKDSKELLKSY